MIGFLKGHLALKQPPLLILEVSGVGYEIEAPMNTFYSLPDEGASVSLYTHLIIRDDAHLLFGFSDVQQKKIFRELIKLNGIGPRAALSILSTFSVSEFINCITEQRADALTRTPGIGKKTAERMIIEFKDKITTLSEIIPLNERKEILSNPSHKQDAISALVSLGYKSVEARRVVDSLGTKSTNREDIIREALKNLSR